MRLVVQHLATGLFLSEAGRWVNRRENAMVFADATAAIAFCISKSVRAVRVVSTAAESGANMFFYPFGNDPATKVAEKNVRRAVAEGRRLREKMRLANAHPELRAESKE